MLLPVLLKQIAAKRAMFRRPISSEDVARHFPLRKRGYGGVVDAVRRIVQVMEESPLFQEYAFIVILLDRRTKPAQQAIKQLIRGKQRFVLGIAIEEIEAWWLGDRVNTLAWLKLGSSSIKKLNYGAKGYKAEKDKTPKRTLDELTMLSKAVDSRYGKHGNLGLAEEFAEIWNGKARLDGIEGQCPKGFGKFAAAVKNEFQKAKSISGCLF